MQETLLKALRYKDKYTDNTNLKAWLFTIMKNTFINSYHKAVRSKTFVDTTDNDYFINDAGIQTYTTPDSEVNHQEVITAIDKLPADLRTPFEKHTMGFKYREIADELEIPIGTVKNRIFLARKRLEAELKEFRYRNC